MNEIWITTSLIFTLLVRIAIPISITLLLSWGLRKLDARWRQEGESPQKAAQPTQKKTIIPCWVFNNCPEDVKKTCNASSNPLMPCWDSLRMTDGRLSAKCAACQYYQQATRDGVTIAPAM